MIALRIFQITAILFLGFVGGYGAAAESGDDDSLHGAWMFVESEFTAPPPVEGGYAVERRAEIAA